MCRNDHGRYTVDADDEVTYHADGQYELNDKKIPIAPSNCWQDAYLLGPDDEHVLDDDAPIRIPSVCSRCWIRCKYFTARNASVHWCTFFAFIALYLYFTWLCCTIPIHKVIVCFRNAALLDNTRRTESDAGEKTTYLRWIICRSEEACWRARTRQIFWHYVLRVGRRHEND